MAKTFEEMSEALRQFERGLLHPAEVILALQCDSFQLAALRQMVDLPLPALSKVRLHHFDDAVAIARVQAEQQEQET